MRIVDKQRLARLYMWTVVIAGAAVLSFSLSNLVVSRLGTSFLLLAAVTIGVGSRINIQVPRFKSIVSISDVFVFLTILLFDGEAAILLGTAEALLSSLGVTKKPLTIAFNAAAMSCSTFLAVWALRFGFGSIVEIPRSGYFLVSIMAMCVMALLQYIGNSGLIAMGGALRVNQPIWHTWKKYYGWTAISYFACAFAAGIIAKLNAVVGYPALIAMLPIVGVVYLTYLTYLKNIEASLAQAEQAERHLAELQESEGRFRSAFDHAPIGMALVAPQGRWLQVNHSLCELLGYSEQELLKKEFQAMTHPDDLGPFLYRVRQVLDGDAITHQMEKRYFHKRGHEVWVMAGISLIRDSQSSSTHLIFQIQDITDRKRAEERLLHDAFHDTLTGLPNRAWFMEQLRISLNHADQADDYLFAVLFLDLDRFKIINDSIGHKFGDELLIGIADRLRNCLRVGDKVARLGGDEFTILLRGIKDSSDAVTVAERVQEEVSKPFTLDSYETFTTASIGIAIFDPGYTEPEDLLRDADTAMYRAKSLGKAQHVIFDKGMHASAMNLLQLETDLRRAIDRKEFLIHYQAIVSLKTGKLTGFEALVRWRHPERGLISPAEFIPVAEETGLIVPIGQWVLAEACRQMQRWHDQFFFSRQLSVSVNLSSKQFAHSGLIEQVIQVLDMTGLNPRKLKLEITESVVMDNIEVATGMLEHLRALGVELSIDDFGTGYSSLSYLHRLPIDTLKIDRSFVGRITENNENKEIVRTIVMLAQNLGMGVVAEGVETVEQMQRLQELQCDHAQGYLFSKPLDREVVERLIQETSPWRAADLSTNKSKQEGAFEPLSGTCSMIPAAFKLATH